MDARLGGALLRAGQFLLELWTPRSLPVIGLLLCIAVALTLAGAPGAVAAELTEAERQWVEDHPDVTIGVVSDNEPYSFFRNGRTMGWTLDVLERVSAETGIRFIPRMGAWPEIYRTFRAGGLDAIADISMTRERLPFINFTDAYHQRRTVVFQNVDSPLPDPVDIASLADRRVGVIADIYYTDALRDAGIEPVPYSTYRDLMAALAFKWVDAAIAAEMTGNFFARENGFSNISVAGTLPLASAALEDFRLGTMKADGETDRAMLAAILAKGVGAVPTDELAAITARWLTYRSDRPPLGAPLRLLPEERNFIANTPPLTIGYMNDYEPFSFLADGRGQGFAVELANEISAATGLPITPIYDNWASLLAAFRAGDIDIISNISKTADREAFTLYSREYYRIPNAVYVRSGFGPYQGLESLADRTVAIGEDIYYADALRSQLGNVRAYSSQEAILMALAEGEVDAAIMALSNGNAIIRRLGLINIEIGGEFLMDGVQREDLRFGVSPRYPYARSIIDRAMSAMTAGRWNELETHWLGPPVAKIAQRRRQMLTEEEQDYLDDKGVVSVCIDAMTPPYTSIDAAGNLNGVAAQVLNLLADRGGFKWQFVPTSTRSGSVETDRPECDVRPFTTDHQANGAWSLSRPYLILPMAVVNEIGDPFAESMTRLSGKRVGVSPTESPMGMLARRYPDVELVEVASETDALEGVRDGTLDAAIGTLPSLGYLLAQAATGDVKISGRIAEDWRAAIATRANQPLLAGIFDKLIADLDPVEVQSILSNQMLVRIERRVDYALLAELGAAALFVIALIIYWNRKLKRLNVALEAANRKLQELSVTDVLTGLANRRHFDRRIGEALGLSQRNRIELSLAMIDVDHFKHVNDEMGHQFGDQCLQYIAELARKVFRREGDVLARYGGEEFVVFSFGGTNADFVSRVELLRRQLAETPFRADGQERRLTISAGCYTAVPAMGADPGEFVGRADALLYEAKQAGRNRIAADPPDEGLPPNGPSPVAAASS